FMRAKPKQRRTGTKTTKTPSRACVRSPRVRLTKIENGNMPSQNRNGVACDDAESQSNELLESESTEKLGQPNNLVKRKDAFATDAEEAANLLKPCPASGEGVHRWVYYAACALTDQGLDDCDAEWIIEAGMTRDPNPENEIESALKAARGERASTIPRWPAANPCAIADLTSDGCRIIDLIDRSPE